MKSPFKKEIPTPTPKVLLFASRFHLLQEMKLGINEQDGTPYYILKFELVADMNELQAILATLQSDGSIVADILDGKATSNNY